MDFDLEVKLAVYRQFAQTGKRPLPEDVSEIVSAAVGDVVEAYARLRSQRVLVLETDGRSILMAPPFSGVDTQHVVVAGRLSYFANCAWDALGIPAALHLPAIVHSRCEQSREPLRLEVSVDGPGSSEWLFHCLVPAAHWWENIVFT